MPAFPWAFSTTEVQSLKKVLGVAAGLRASVQGSLFIKTSASMP